jgi:hypothetical protein
MEGEQLLVFSDKQDVERPRFSSSKDEGWHVRSIGLKLLLQHPITSSGDNPVESESKRFSWWSDLKEYIPPNLGKSSGDTFLENRLEVSLTSLIDLNRLDIGLISFSF